MPAPVSLADYERAFADALTDSTLTSEARSAYLWMLARDVRRAQWRDASAGAKLAARIEASIDRSVDLLSGLDTLVAAGRVEPAPEASA